MEYPVSGKIYRVISVNGLRTTVPELNLNVCPCVFSHWKTSIHVYPLSLNNNYARVFTVIEYYLCTGFHCPWIVHMHVHPQSLRNICLWITAATYFHFPWIISSHCFHSSWITAAHVYPLSLNNIYARVSTVLEYL